jgi:hypothetical protein
MFLFVEVFFVGKHGQQIVFKKSGILEVFGLQQVLGFEGLLGYLLPFFQRNLI